MVTPDQRALAAGARLLTATDGRDMLVNTPDGWEIDKPWLWFDGPASGDGGGTVYGNPPPNAAGYNRYACIPAVARCTSIIADTLASMPFKVLRGREVLPVPDWLTDPQAVRIDGRIAAPELDDVRFTGPEFWAQHLTSVLWKGEGIVYAPLRTATGQPVPGAMWNLNPDDVAVHHGHYWVDGHGVTDSEQLALEDLIITRGYVRPGKRRGVGVIQNHFADLGLALDARDFAGNMLRRGIPAGYLKVNQPDLTQEAADALKTRWEASHNGRRKRIAVLNAVTEFHELQLDPQAMQLLEMRRYSILDICLMFGVPPSLLGLPGDSSTYANVESRFIEFVQFCLFMWARRLEEALSAQIARGTSIKVNLDSLRRADTTTRYNAHKTGIDAGFLDVEEVRDMEDLPEAPQSLIARNELVQRAREAHTQTLERAARAQDRRPLETATAADGHLADVIYGSNP